MPGPAQPRVRARERPRLRALAALVASTALNAVVLWWLAGAGAFAPPARTERTAVALAPLSSRTWSENRQVRAPRPPPRPEPGRVIEQAPGKPPSERPPEDSRFLSDRNARVERETVSRDAGHFPRVAPRPEPAGRGESSPRAAGRAAPPSPAVRPPSRRDGPLERRLTRSEGLEPAPDGERATGARPPAPGAAPGSPRAEPDLRPSADSLARIAGGPSMDGYREVEEGEETALSSREFRFATFLNRMRSAIGDIWYPTVETAIRERDPEGRDVFFRERTVVLELTLGPSGELRRLRIAESSEVPFVDEVAVAAVRKAQPFSNPPRAMFGPGGEARIPFAFTVFPFERRGVVRWRPPVSR